MPIKHKEEYVKDGVWYPTRAAAILVTPQQVIDAGCAARPTLDPRYIVATAQHESRFAINEVDTEPSGFISKGIFQISDEEARSAGLPGVNLLTLDASAQVMVRLALRNRDAFQQAGGNPFANDVNGWLALAHNEGRGAMRKTIATHGTLWGDPYAFPNPSDDAPESYRYRNAWRAIVAYGDDCITGGAVWREKVAKL